MAKRILAVDDERHILRLIEVNLKAAGFEVVCAANGLEALAAVAAQPIDLVVLDWAMPEMDGLEALKRLKADETTRHIPVIMLTAKAQDADVYKGWSAQVDAYLTKPFNPRELIDFVSRLAADGEDDEDDELDDMLI